MNPYDANNSFYWSPYFHSYADEARSDNRGNWACKERQIINKGQWYQFEFYIENGGTNQTRLWVKRDGINITNDYHDQWGQSELGLQDFYDQDELVSPV